jgi:hypothetical protein
VLSDVFFSFEIKTKEKKTSDNTYQANKNKRKKPIGQHLSGKQKQKKKNIGQHVSGKQKQKKKNHRTTRIRQTKTPMVFFFCFCLPDKCCPMISSFVFVCLIRVVRGFFLLFLFA